MLAMRKKFMDLLLLRLKLDNLCLIRVLSLIRWRLRISLGMMLGLLVFKCTKEARIIIN